MPFPFIPFLIGAAVGSLVTYVLMRDSATIDIEPTPSTARTERADDGADSAVD